MANLSRLPVVLRSLIRGKLDERRDSAHFDRKIKSAQIGGEQTLVVQLFNGRAPTARNRPESEFDTHPVLRAQGFKTRELTTYPWPCNPFANMHNAYRGLDPLRALCVLLKYRKAGLICAHLESAAVILMLKKLFFFRVPVLIWEVPWSPGWRYREILSRIAIPRADTNVVFGSNQIQLLRACYGESVLVEPILFCIDTDYYRPVPRSTEVHRPVVWSCGLDPGRDFGLLLEAAEGIDATIRIKAAPDLALDLKSYPNAVQEMEYLPREEFRQAYADAAVVVVCTKSTLNAAGVTSLMEALSMGRPTIVSDNPALRDYLPPSDAAIVVPVGDGEALRNAIRWVLEHPAEAEEMGRKARAFAEARFSVDYHFEAMGRIFFRTIAGNRESRP
jgi:glycosyltransferase involved in cell wall biosynthesis